MRKNILGLTLAVLALLSAAILATLGILNDEPSFYLFAVWAIAIATVLFYMLVYAIYHRINYRVSQATRMLAEIKFTQKRRYEQFAKQLDALGANASGTQDGRRTVLTEVQEVNTRFQLAERRILGLLENKALAGDKQIRQMELLLTRLSEDSGSIGG